MISSSRKKIFVCLFIFLILTPVFGVFADQTGDQGSLFTGNTNIQPGETSGGWLSTLLHLGEQVVAGILSAVFMILGSAALGILGLTEILFNWVIGPDFISVSFTGADNIFVYESWLMIRDFANIGIVLSMVYAGLRMALGIGSFQTKRTLVRLIGLAFLINFTPVLIGLVIDASNIAMNYFFRGAENMTLGGELRRAMYQVNPISSSSSGMIGLIQLFIVVCTIFFIALLYLILTATFVMRYVVLWVLIILSPLAFLAFAFSGGEKFWRQWWSNFISWTFVGVPIAFFVNLALKMLKHIQNGVIWKNTSEHIATIMSVPDATSPLAQGAFAGDTFYAILPAAFLYIGYIISMNLAPSVTKTVVDFTEKQAKQASRWGWDQARYRTSRAYEGAKQEVRSDHLLQTASSLGLKTDGWDDPKRSHAVRARVADEIKKSELATAGDKANAARFISTEKKLTERKIERSRFGKRLQEANTDDLTAMLFEPGARKFSPRGGFGVSSEESKAMVIHELMKKDPKEAVKVLGSLSLSQDEAVRIFTGLVNQGPSYSKDAQRFAVSQMASHGEVITQRAEELGLGDHYLYDIIKKVEKDDEEDISLIAKAYVKGKKEIHAGDRATRDSVRNNMRAILDGSLNAKPDAVIRIIKSLPSAEDRIGFAETIVSYAKQTNQREPIQVIKALARQGFLPKEFISI